MKKPFEFLFAGLTALTLTLASAALAGDAGGGSTGGGDPELSSVAKVEGEAWSAARMMAYMLDSSRYDFKRAPLVPKDPRAYTMAQQIFKKVDIAKLENGTAYYWQRTGACPDGSSSERSGGAVIGEPSKPFCLNLKRLQLVPPFQIQEQLIGLMAHELAHQAGYYEEDANRFQIYILRQIKNHEAKGQTLHMVTLAKEHLLEARRLIQAGDDQTNICSTLGQLDGVLHSLARMSFIHSPSGIVEPGDDDAFTRGMRLSHMDVFEFMTYCGVPQQETQLPPRTIVAKGDSAKLFEVFDALLGNIHDIRQDLSLW